MAQVDLQKPSPVGFISGTNTPTFLTIKSWRGVVFEPNYQCKAMQDDLRSENKTISISVAVTSEEGGGVRLTKIDLIDITGTEQAKRQASWFMKNFGVAVKVDRLGPILTREIFEEIVARQIGLPPKRDRAMPSAHSRIVFPEKSKL